MIDKNPFQIDRFRGINRGSQDTQFGIEFQDDVAFDEALDCENIIFTREGKIRTRPPFREKLTVDTHPSDVSGVLRQHWKIARLGTTYYDNRWLYLTFDRTTNTGRFYDSIAPTTILKAIANMRFASVINIYGRLYISPLSDFGEPLTGTDGVIWLYDGTTFRKAGGTAPTAGTLAITDTAVGGANVTPGLHIGAIAFETDSGFITPAGPTTRIQVTIAATGGRAARFTNVDIGPAGTVARHLLLTKTIPTYDGIQDNWELFFALRIPNNVATTGDVVLPDTGLVDSADYLLSEQATLPSCAAISIYGTHLMYNGINTDKRVIYVSKGNDPETVDTTEDYIQVFDGIPIEIYNGRELRGVYYFFKENCTFAVQENSDPPNAWRVDLVDSGLGISPWGIAEVLANPGGLVLDNLIVSGPSGIYIFSGSFSHIPISDNIVGFWRSLSKAQVKYTRLTVDPNRKRLYIITAGDFGGDAGGGASDLPFQLWHADYTLGLGSESVRWARWALYYTSEGEVYPLSVLNILVDPNNGNTKKAELTFVGLFESIWEFRDDLVAGSNDIYDNANPSSVKIRWFWETGFSANLGGYMYSFHAALLRMILKTDGTNPGEDTGDRIVIDVLPMDTTLAINTTREIISAQPEKMYNVLLGDQVSEKMRLKISGYNTMYLTKLVLWATEKGKTRTR